MDGVAGEDIMASSWTSDSGGLSNNGKVWIFSGADLTDPDHPCGDGFCTAAEASYSMAGQFANQNYGYSLYADALDFGYDATIGGYFFVVGSPYDDDSDNNTTDYNDGSVHVWAPTQ